MTEQLSFQRRRSRRRSKVRLSDSMRKLPFATICAHKKSVDSHVRIRIGHPIAVSWVMGFPMFSQYRLEFELLAAAFEGANILDVSIFFVLAHQCFALKRLLAFFHWAKDLKRQKKILFDDDFELGVVVRSSSWKTN